MTVNQTDPTAATEGDGVTPPPVLTEVGRLRAQVEVLHQDAERDRGLVKLGARCFRDHHDGQITEGRATVEGHRFALSVTLGLGTGAPWDAIHERVKELAAVRAATSAVVSPPPSRTAEVRERLLGALDFSYCQGLGYSTPEALLSAYDASAVLPEPADRAAVLEEAADKMLALRDSLITAPDATGKYLAGIERAETELRRLAGEAHPTSTAPLAAGRPHVQGHCPACGTTGLFLGNGGYVTCSRVDCPEPDAASTVLERPPAASEAQQPDTGTLAAIFEGFGLLLATSSRDWSEYAPDAWLYAVILGWDCEATEHDELCTHGAMEEMQQRHGWSDEAVAKARRYRTVVRSLTERAPEQQPAADTKEPHQ
jgi:hypothetical protein